MKKKEGVVQFDTYVRAARPHPNGRWSDPLIFFDHLGPAAFHRGRESKVRPYPHIGIAMISHLFKGEFMDRESLGYKQTVFWAGAVNLIVAGQGIVHSERVGEGPGFACNLERKLIVPRRPRSE